MIVARLCIGLAAMVAAEKAQRIPVDRGRLPFVQMERVERTLQIAEGPMLGNSMLQTTKTNGRHGDGRSAIRRA